MQNGKDKTQATNHSYTHKPTSVLYSCKVKFQILSPTLFSTRSIVNQVTKNGSVGGNFLYNSFNSSVAYFSKPLGIPCGTLSKNVCILYTKKIFGTYKENRLSAQRRNQEKLELNKNLENRTLRNNFFLVF